MTKLTMLEMRQRAREVVERLGRGESFTLTYRNRPVGELRPVVGETGVDESDPIYRLAEDAGELGGSLSVAEADRLIYGP